MIWFSPEYMLYTICGIVMLPAIIFSIIVGAMVQTTFKRFAKVKSAANITGAEAATQILESRGLGHIRVQQSSGAGLSDNYSSETKTVSLSRDVFGSTSVSAICVAAHEACHAIQDEEGYRFMQIRALVAKISGFSSSFLWAIIMIGFIFNFAAIGGVFGDVLLVAGVAFFGLSFVFSLITLPVELNASKRALQIMLDENILTNEETKNAKKVLGAAARTYVAALLVSLLQLARFLLYIFLRNRD